MVRTVVCTKDGCKGNEFYISMQDAKLKAICKECGAAYEYSTDFYDYNVLSECSRCKGEVFKLLKDYDSEKVYMKCIKCGSPPEKVFIDDDGIQITYEEKLLQDIKIFMQKIEQRICNVEHKVDSLDKGQELLEESLAYINKYMNS